MFIMKLKELDERVVKNVQLIKSRMLRRKPFDKSLENDTCV